ncbi:MAG: hypothetical protein ACOY5C_03035 [Pseudomonadota bacterium]
MKCPDCGSENTQALNLVYSSGLSNVNTKTRGVGVGIAGRGLGLGVGSAKTTGIQQTELSTLATPPKRIYYRNIILATVVVFFVGILFFESAGDGLKTLWMIACLAGGGLLFKSAYHYNNKVFPRKMGVWNRSFLCLRCGTQFEKV